MSKLSIFLSHTYEERKLADAFRLLVESVSNDQIDVWYSSDPRPTGGTDLGNWRQQIHKELDKAKQIIAIITPESNDRPWIAYETGFSNALKKSTTPLFYFMEREQIKFFDNNISSYNGNNNSEVIKLLTDLMNAAGLEMPKGDRIELAWGNYLNEYSLKLTQEEALLRGRQLFQDHFHDAKLTEAMEDKEWFAAWTVFNADEKEEEWSTDILKCWSTDTRIRFVGTSSQTTYPMEGVRSRMGYISLSYWSEGQIPICGTVLLKPNIKGDKYSGKWSGYSSKSLETGSLNLVEGNVFISTIKDETNDWLQSKINSKDE